MVSKTWTVIDRLAIIWNSELSDQMKRDFFQAAVVSVLLYGCTTWMLIKYVKEKARRELHKNAEIILEATPQETIVLLPLASNL